MADTDSLLSNSKRAHELILAFLLGFLVPDEGLELKDVPNAYGVWSQ